MTPPSLNTSVQKTIALHKLNRFYILRSMAQFYMFSRALERNALAVGCQLSTQLKGDATQSNVVSNDGVTAATRGHNVVKSDTCTTTVAT